MILHFIDILPGVYWFFIVTKEEFLAIAAKEIWKNWGENLEESLVLDY